MNVKKQMRWRIVALSMVLLMVFLSGCQFIEQKVSEAEQLLQSKNPFAGDAAADGKILELLNIGSNIGSYTFELNTAQEPYGMKILFDQLAIDAAQVDQKMKEYAVLIFALTENLDVIQWVYLEDANQKVVEISRDLLQQETGINIDELAQTTDAIQAQLDRIQNLFE